MDPCGPQKKIKGNEYHASFEKLVNGGGSKSSYGGGLNMESTNRKVSSGEVYKQDQGKVRGGIKHTYGVNGENDPD